MSTQHLPQTPLCQLASMAKEEFMKQVGRHPDTVWMNIGTYSAILTETDSWKWMNKSAKDPSGKQNILGMGIIFDEGVPPGQMAVGVRGRSMRMLSALATSLSQWEVPNGAVRQPTEFEAILRQDPQKGKPS